MKKFKKYLLNKGLTEVTIDGYCRRLRFFLDWVEEKQLPLKRLKYNHILNYVSVLNERNLRKRTVNGDILAIRYYYDFLNLKDNPAKGIRVKGVVKKVVNNILEEEQLIDLYNTFEVKEESIVSYRDKVILGLIVFQGLTSGDLSQLTLDDIDLDKGTVKIKARTITNKRLLKLKVNQMITLYTYIKEIHPKLLEEREEESTKLILSLGNGEGINNVLSRLVNKINSNGSDKITLKQIRASVIVSWVKKYNLREAQYKAGHRYVSSTEKYKQQDLKDLQEELDRFHPF